MKKPEFVAIVAEKTGQTKKQISETLEVMMEVIMEEVAAGNEVQFYNFGTFTRSFRAERHGTNPFTKSEMVIPAHYLPAFKSGEGFKKQLKEVPTPA